jgi:hypothetical protein
VLMPVPHARERFGPGLGGVNAVIQPLLHAADHANIDPARVYVVGHGIAAQAAWNLALHRTTYFTAFQALASPPLHDWQRARLINLGSVAPVAWHDAEDDVAAIAPTRQAINTLRRMKYEVHFIETRGIGHIPTVAVMEEGYAVMRQRERSLYPAAIALQSSRPETVNNRQDWMQVYQPARPGAERRILIRGGPEHMLVAQHPWLARASVTNNRVEVRTDNVLSMRLYFNDQLLDLDQPVTIVLNGREQYQGPIERNIEEMLKDQVFLGRGWRYYTGMIDVGFQ